MNMYCECEQPEIERTTDDYDDHIVTYFCTVCEKEADPRQPEEYEEEVLI